MGRDPQGGWELGSTADSGFSAELRDGFVAPHTALSALVHDATKAYEGRHDVVAARDAIEKAVALAPDDPSLRLSAAWLALEANLADRALVHVHAGLACETDPYRRGQLLLWGARAAERSDPSLARRWRAELARIPGDSIEELRVRGREKHRGKPHPNLTVADAY